MVEFLLLRGTLRERVSRVAILIADLVRDQLRTNHTHMLSVVITAHNERGELARTVASVQENTSGSYEILIIDDGSTDGSCESLRGGGLRMIRHPVRIGVAYSRHEAVCEAVGSAIAFLDGHQRISQGCLERCADVALAYDAIVTPDIAELDSDSRIMHGAYFTLHRTRPPFAAEWKALRPVGELGSISSLRAPAYVIPRKVYSRIHWSPLLCGWGGSEAAISLKAFFSGVEILHLCGPVAWHQFKRQFHYDVSWDEVWRNHAVTARICFSERTWSDYWWPEVFSSKLGEEAAREMDSAEIRAEHEEFQRIKVRSDREFWTKLVFRHPPDAVGS